MTIFETKFSPSLGVWGMLAERTQGWRKELPAIVQGLWQLTKPFRRQVTIIASVNLLIVLWDTAQPYILSVGVDALVDKAAYATIIKAIIYPVLVIALPYGIVLPLFRELYTVRHFRPWLMKHLSLTCLQSSCTLRDKGPTAQQGRDVAVPLIDTLLRDPLYMIRGLVLLGVLTYLSTLLGAILICGMLLDLAITLVMESKLNHGYDRQRRLEFRIKGLENAIHDGEPHLHAREEIEALWDEYARLARSVETKRLWFQSVLREGCAQAIRIGLMLLVGWWVHLGYTSVGEYILFTTLAGRANDPLYVFFNLQQVLMQNREVLRRFESMSGVLLTTRPA